MPSPTDIFNQTMRGYSTQVGQYDQGTNSQNQQWNALYNQQAQYGDSQRLALNQQYQRSLASQQQGMLARGLGNTTVLDAGARGINYDYANSLLTLNDQLLQRQNSIKQAQLGYQAQAQQGRAGLQGQALGSELGYGQAVLGSQTQYGIAGMQASAAMQQTAAQQMGQLQQMQQAQLGNQREAAQQYNINSALGAQQANQQSAISAQNYNQQAALNNQQLQGQSYMADNFGYY